MRITKYGHCCLLIEENGLRILTDPGAYSTKQDDITNIDIVLITHEHPDHLHIESLKCVIRNNPQTKIITNQSVGKILDVEGIKYELLVHNQHKKIGDVILEGFGEKHAEIYKEFGQVENTGYFINNKMFYPGDALTNPGKHVEILALPVAGPWIKVKEAIQYALEINPKKCFPVHDGMFAPGRGGTPDRVCPKFLGPENIEYITLGEGETKEF